MASEMENGDRRGGNRWRIVLWSIPALLLLIPLVGRWPWTLSDFVFMGVLFGSVGLVLELAVRASSSIAYRAGVAVAVAAAFFLIWLNLAVGIIGSEDNPANQVYGGVLAVAAIGSVLARFRPGGMVFALIATALTQAAIAVYGLIAGLGAPLPLEGFFVAAWLGSAALFRRAAQPSA